jgi:hypothetical protein
MIVKVDKSAVVRQQRTVRHVPMKHATLVIKFKNSG